MKESKKTIGLGVLLVAALVILLFLKYQSPALIESLYQGRSFSLLNKIAFSQGENPLGFYLGRAEKFLFGPLFIFGTMAVLLILSLKFLKDSSLSRFALVILLFLLITKFDVLLFPPYGELAAGPYAESTWLAQHDFDYAKLAAQPNFSQGGPKVYLTSLYTSLVAVLMKISPDPKVFLFLNHLLIFVWAAFVLAMLRSILARTFDPTIALLASLSVLAMPLFQSMTENLYMEMMTLFFAVGSAYFLIDKKMPAASILAVLAAWSKGSGGYACGAVLLVGIALFFWDKEKRRSLSCLFWGAGSVVLGSAKLLLWRLLIYKTQPAANAFKLLVGIRPLWLISKAQLILFVLSLVGVGYLYWKEKHQGKKQSEAFALSHYPVFVMFIFAGSWFGLFLNVSVMAYRYELLLLPFLAVCLLFILSIFVRSPRRIAVFLVGVIALGALGSYGLFHFKKYKSTIYSYHKFERSLEYRCDLKMHLMLAQEIEEKYAQYTIGAPFVVAQKLALTNLGYVRKPLDVVIYGMGATYGGIRNFPGLRKMPVSRTVWIGFTENHVTDKFAYPIDPKDRILERIVYGDHEAVLFQGGVAIEKMRMLVEAVRKGMLR